MTMSDNEFSPYLVKHSFTGTSKVHFISKYDKCLNG